MYPNFEFSNNDGDAFFDALSDASIQSSYWSITIIAFIEYCVSVTVQCVRACISVSMIYTCRGTHIDAHTWTSLRMADGKVSP